MTQCSMLGCTNEMSSELRKSCQPCLVIRRRGIEMANRAKRSESLEGKLCPGCALRVGPETTWARGGLNCDTCNRLTHRNGSCRCGAPMRRAQKTKIQFSYCSWCEPESAPEGLLSVYVLAPNDDRERRIYRSDAWVRRHVRPEYVDWAGRFATVSPGLYGWRLWK